MNTGNEIIKLIERVDQLEKRVKDLEARRITNILCRDQRLDVIGPGSVNPLETVPEIVCSGDSNDSN